MSLIEKALFSIIGENKTITSPTFLKDFEKENNQLRDLIELSNKVSNGKKDFIDRDINFLKQGLDGEQNVYFELKNSFISMLCLHDIRLEYNDYIAQFDFILITCKFIYVLETKKLNGDIEINKDGDFIRTIRNSSGKFIKKEGMYSPISQNDRHVNILREVLVKEGLIRTMPIKSAVVIANPKSIIDKTKCPKNIRDNIYKYDQIANLLKKEMNDKNNDKDVYEKYLFNIANYLIANNKPITFDYTTKYSLTEEDFKQDQINKKDNIIKKTENVNLKPYEIKCNENRQASPVVNSTNINEDAETYELLKKYRLNVSKEEGLKAYMIFNNEELDALIDSKPKNKEELLKVKGFGGKKVEKYGEAILSIINK